MAAISIHALLAESDSKGTLTAWIAKDFYPRSPCGERRAAIRFFALVTIISIHALLAESDVLECSEDTLNRYFYPRSPCGERPREGRKTTDRRQKFLSTLSLRRATFFALYDQTGMVISIHALLAESDRSPLRSSSLQSRFLSTLSLRRATGGPRFSG